MTVTVKVTRMELSVGGSRNLRRGRSADGSNDPIESRGIRIMKLSGTRVDVTQEANSMQLADVER